MCLNAKEYLRLNEAQTCNVMAGALPYFLSDPKSVKKGHNVEVDGVQGLWFLQFIDSISYIQCLPYIPVPFEGV